MIDLAALKRSAEAGNGEDRAAVTRRFLVQVHDELVAGRAAQAELEQLRASQGRVFGLVPEKRL